MLGFPLTKTFINVRDQVLRSQKRPQAYVSCVMVSEYLLTLGQRHISFANVPLNLFEHSSKWRWVIKSRNVPKFKGSFPSDLYFLNQRPSALAGR